VLRKRLLRGCVDKANLRFRKLPGMTTLLLREADWDQLGAASPGSAGRNRACNIKLLEKRVPVPALEQQVWFDTLQSRLLDIKQSRAETQKELDALMPSVPAKVFAGEL